MESQNKYIGDDKFEKMLAHYRCPTPLAVIKMRFVGALCSPNLSLRPTDVIASFWPQGQSPRLETKEEADLFFKFFMGLWDECFEKVKNNHVKISPIKAHDKESLIAGCQLRYAEVENGFIEGFWGGKEDLKIPAYLAEIIDSLSDIAGVYETLIKKLDNKSDLGEISNTIKYSDNMVEKAVSFVIENSVLPRIDSLRREVHP